MHKLLAIISISSLLLLTGCIKSQRTIDRELAYEKCDTIIVTQDGKFTKSYFTKNDSIVFNSTNTCITFIDMFTKAKTITCGTFTIKAKPINYKE